MAAEASVALGFWRNVPLGRPFMKIVDLSRELWEEVLIRIDEDCRREDKLRRVRHGIST